ncbi:hypothetical protein FACS18942_05600 [Planctomycetales bacterium]|nr:hypothetical protein FACS18942_05600 [Planctomycetales bacterium]GHT35438.1 hypothetical protein FACS189427_04710 [Planctomycetales bacterium]
MRKIISFSIAGLALYIICTSTGCLMHGPTIGLASIPIPVSPYFQGGYEDEAYEKERYRKVAVLEPITEKEHIALDPPSDDQCIRQLEKIRPVSGAVPGMETSFRNVKGITKELIADYVDPPRVMPLTGPVQVHHAHYKVTIYFEEQTNVGWPIPYTIKNEDAVEVFYIDMDHLHRVSSTDQNAAM